MWHEARRQERKIRGMLVDYRKRAERRRDFYERIKADPTQFLQVHGRQCKIHLDPAVAAAADSAVMMPWQGQADNLIDRFDVRAHLDYIPPVLKEEETELTQDERQLNYERYRIIGQNAYLGISEEKFLKQLHLEEQFGYTEAKIKKEPKGTGVAIGFNYEDGTAISAPPNTDSAPDNSDDDNSDSDLDVDLAINVSKIDSAQAHEMNKHGQHFGMLGNDFYSFLTNDLEEAESYKLAKEEEHEKALFSGRKSRRERRAHREKRLANRKISPPSYAAKESPTNPVVRDESKSPSRSPSLDAGKITYITSFGDEEEPSSSSKPSYADKVKYGKPNKRDTSSDRLVYYDKKNSRSNSREISYRKRRSRSRSKRSRSRSKRSRSRNRNSRSVSKSRYKRFRRSHSRGRRSNSRGRRSNSRGRRSRNRRSVSKSRSAWSRRSRSRSRSGRRRSVIKSGAFQLRPKLERNRSKSRSRKSVSRSLSRSRSGPRRSRSRSTSRRLNRRRSSSSSSLSSSSSSVSKSGSKTKSKSKSPSPKAKSKTPQPPSPPKIIPRYYGRRRSDQSSESESSDEDENIEADMNSANLVSGDSTFGSGNNTGTVSKKASTTLTVIERLKRKRQALINKQFKKDKIAEVLKLEREKQEQQTREDELREMAIKLRRRQREKRHAYDRSSSSESDKSNGSQKREKSESPKSRDRDSNKSDRDKRGRDRRSRSKDRSRRGDRRDRDRDRRRSTSGRRSEKYENGGRKGEREKSPEPKKLVDY